MVQGYTTAPTPHGEAHYYQRGEKWRIRGKGRDREKERKRERGRSDFQLSGPSHAILSRETDRTHLERVQVHTLSSAL